MTVHTTSDVRDTSVEARSSEPSRETTLIPRQAREPAAETVDDPPSAREPSADSSAEELLRALKGLEPDDPLGERLRERVMQHYRPVLHRIARHYSGRGEPEEDLRQTAHVGLAKAIRGYVPERGKAFISYLLPTVTGEIKRHFRDHTWAVHIPREIQSRRPRMNQVRQELEQQLARSPSIHEIAQSMELSDKEVERILLASEAYNTFSFGSYNEDSPSPMEERIGSEDHDLHMVVDRESLRTACALLAPRERLILKRRFFDEWTQGQIAEEVGCSQMHVSRLLVSTLRTLRTEMVALS
ncbi:SigB/SigF/SigG family RNA polymerase sigma factor [Nocardiopsis xinjiangensis]|uniref:SigB/SigF/SigG family RNA polymerase sigma factor n=1 Tax=Nocardiopsis xinjiangensis TaxID=124285 RepID=UPI000382C0DF|nr:SigB/SigF/SigG family RNA polymerase sigma factor [Nocardiopsis xinjiangensis]